MNTTGEALPYPGLIALAKPVAFWPLSDRAGRTAVDQTGVNNGTYAGGVTLGGAGPISGQPAARFDGRTGHVTVPDSPSLHTGDSFSLEAWIKPARLGIQNGIVAKGRSPNQAYGAYMFFLNAKGQLSSMFPTSARSPRPRPRSPTRPDITTSP